MFALFVLAAGCTTDPPAKDADANIGSSGPASLRHYYSNNITVGPRVTPCVVVCSVSGYSHRVAPNESFVTDLDIKVTWPKPSALCDKLSLEVLHRYGDRGERTPLAAKVGASPLILKLTNLTVAEKAGPTYSFLRVTVFPHAYDVAGSDVYANLRIDYRIETFVTYRPFQAGDYDTMNATKPAPVPVTPPPRGAATDC